MRRARPTVVRPLRRGMGLDVRPPAGVPAAPAAEPPMPGLPLAAASDAALRRATLRFALGAAAG
jgi:hypothetical protein